MKEIYRIRKGEIVSDQYTIPIDFGLVFEDEGVFLFDLYVNEEYDLVELINKREASVYFAPLRLNAKTEDQNQIEATELFFKNTIPSQSKIQMTCRGQVKYIQKRDGVDNSGATNNTYLFFLEIEGLRMEHTNHTTINKERDGEVIKDFNNKTRDYTKACLRYDNSVTKGTTLFNLIFSQLKGSENILIEFPSYNTKGETLLGYELFTQLKKDFVALLSFLNGAEVAIRKEFLGGFVTDPLGSEVTITYSYKTIKNQKYSEYVPLGNVWFRSEYIMSYALTFCFNAFIEENKKLSLNTTIYYLNGAEQARSVQEKFFILIIALEALAKKCLETVEEPETGYLGSDVFDSIKKKFNETLVDDFGATLKPQDLNDLKGRIGNLNRKSNTDKKFDELLKYGKITKTGDLNRLLKEVRNDTVHEGNIGEGREGVKNYLLLDQLLRDFILNRIGYTKKRNSVLDRW